MDEIIIMPKDQFLKYLDEKFQEVLQEIKNIKKSEIYKEEELISFKETLRLLKISAPTLFNRMKDGSVPYKKVGRRLLFPKHKIISELVNKEK